jgi:MoxR-like ATPase
MLDDEKSLIYNAVLELKDDDVPADDGLNDLESPDRRDELKDDDVPADDGLNDLESPDRRDGRIYVHDQKLTLAVNVALVTGRPLLLRGRPGSSKSSFAAYIARKLGWRYYEYVIMARTQARDLLWTYDAVRRLADAQLRTPENPKLYDYDYVQPGVLWWVLNYESARRRGAPLDQSAPAVLAVEPYADLNNTRSKDKAVLLIDEIDKADPDVPNNLLVPLGSLEFHVEETGTIVKRPQIQDSDTHDARMSRLLVVMTTNEERELPQAFIRRCVVHEIKFPDVSRLVQIAQRHFARPKLKFETKDHTLCENIAKKIVELRQQAISLGIHPPSIAEYLDAVRACRTLRVEVDSEAWKQVERVVFLKQRTLEDDEL